jgi:general secretion pathway protein E
VAPYLISATVLGVLGQRLIRTLCPLCKQPDTTLQRDTLNQAIHPWQHKSHFAPCQAIGCVDCRMTGFKGRLGLYELLTVSEAFKDKISTTPVQTALTRQAISDGMSPLRLAGALKVAEGLTTLDEVLACTPPLQSI